MTKGSIDDIKEAETPKPAPAKAFSYTVLRDLIAEQYTAHIDAQLEDPGVIAFIKAEREARHRGTEQLIADMARANNVRLEKARLAKEANLAVNGANITLATMTGMQKQLDMMPKGQRIASLRIIGRYLRPYCPEAADYLESVE